MAPRSFLRPFALSLSLACAGFASLVACAEGGEPELTFVDEPVTQPSEASAPGQKLPPSNTGEDSGDNGSSGEGGSSSGGADASADAAKDAAVDAAKDAAPDVVIPCVTVGPSNACGLSPQCGCATNQTCDVTNTTSGAVSCVTSGGGTLGSYCTSTTQCAKGNTCTYNACRPHCPTVGAACVGPGLGECAQYYDPAAGTPVTNAKICTVNCDLRSPAAACGSNNCIWDTTIDVTDCDKSGTKTLYDACSRYNECQQGLACADHPFYGLECETWCRLGRNDCGAFESCTDVYGAAAPVSGGDKLGHCQ